jgi:hypothetical protein
MCLNKRTMKYLHSIKALYENDVDLEDEEVLGVHGTSIEAIKYLAIHGRMPTTGLLGTNFHFCPKTGDGYLNGPYEEAKGYAGTSGSRNLLVARLKDTSFPFDRPSIMRILAAAENEFTFNDKLGVQLKEHLGLKDNTELSKYLEKLREERKGVIIGVRREILKLNLAPGVDKDLVVSVSEGLPIAYVSGIDALGQFELDEILKNNLRNVKILY